MAATVLSYYSWKNYLRPSAYRPRPSDRRLLPAMREVAEAYRRLADGQLADQVRELRQLVSDRPLLDAEILISSFALTLEAVRRSLTLVYYDEQLLAGLALATGAIAEMKTGEGKTIVAGLPAALHALTGKGVHVATVNSYLARRDWELMRAPLELLGFQVGLSAEGESPDRKRAAYARDITYATGYELGFDHLRDQAAERSRQVPLLGESFRERLRGSWRGPGELIQRGHALAIVDEVDSVLLDEANTPLILSQTQTSGSASAVVRQAADIARKLVRDRDYAVDRRRKTLHLTAAGLRRVHHDRSSIPNMGLCRPWSVYLEQALHAQLLLQPDVDYVVRDRKVLIVDQHTGRIFADRTWRDGLHQAVEHKEQVPITAEKQSIARISRQRDFGLYDILCGMSGTCTGHEHELRDFYGLSVVVIPERKTNRRVTLLTRYFDCLDAKWQAVCEDLRQRYQRGQPVLVGTRTIGESCELSRRLETIGVPHQLLNGCQDEDEARLVAQAGKLAAVTIATNMAGRGTDICLDEAAMEVGGLHVIATQRQESRRVDRQLIGRAARQGQPGSCQFFVSAEDELLAKYGPYAAKLITAACRGKHESRRNHDALVDRVQQRAEQQAFEVRRELYRQDQWLNDVLVTVAEKTVPQPGTN